MNPTEVSPLLSARMSVVSNSYIVTPETDMDQGITQNLMRVLKGHAKILRKQVHPCISTGPKEKWCNAEESAYLQSNMKDLGRISSELMTTSLGIEMKVKELVKKKNNNRIIHEVFDNEAQREAMFRRAPADAEESDGGEEGPGDMLAELLFSALARARSGNSDETEE